MNLSRVGRYMDALEHAFLWRYLPPSPARVLDVGGGTGRWSRRLLARGDWQLLIEPQLYNLQRLELGGEALRAVRGRGEALPIPANAFDALILVQVIDFIPDRAAFFREVHRVLKPGGVFLLTWTNRHSLKGMLYHAYSTLKGQPPAERYQIYGKSHAENLRLLRESGFSLLGAEGYSWVILPRSHNTRLVDLFATIERALGLRRWHSASPNLMIAARKE